MCLPSLYSITARRILLPLALFVPSKMNISFIAFGTVDFLAAFGITFVLKIWISSQILMLRLAQVGWHMFTDSHFLTGIWWSWRHHNLMCLNNETWSLSRLYFNIWALVKTFWNSFSSASNDGLVDWHIKWNNNNYSCIIIKNIFGSLVRSEFCSIIRKTFDHYLTDFSYFIQESWESYFLVNNFFSFLAKKNK
jgi:hypothetical protein